nr:hypothetical protein GCM10025732_13240 [Glycomyces mayteni]
MSTATVPAARQPTMSPVSKFGQTHSLRRLPVQERSAARVRRMLDAAADLIEEVGYDRLSTTAIAQRADVAIGSVYQFFGDKRSLAEALSQRYIDLYFERLTARFDAEPPPTGGPGSRPPSASTCTCTARRRASASSTWPTRSTRAGPTRSPPAAT